MPYSHPFVKSDRAILAENLLELDGQSQKIQVIRSEFWDWHGEEGNADRADIQV
jgi:hypothetical protein